MMKAVCLLILAFCASTASAGEIHFDFFGPETITGWVDLRLDHTDGEASWLDGGFGKLRTGGTSDGARLAQAALLWSPRLSDNVTGHVLVQDVPDAHHPFGVSEAYLKWKPVPTSPTRFGLRLGRMFPPVSLEHDGPGWTTTRTLTPSAINSWVGEELLVDGLEANVQRSFGDQGVAGTFGLYRSADTAGTILAFRGWALHDIASSGNTALPLPAGNGTGYSAVFLKQAPYSKPAAEVDGRMGYYGRIDWHPPAPVALNLIISITPERRRLSRTGSTAGRRA
ncbi:MAG: hypothetical protein JF615_06670 [Asticcacaulis sp.]|nr:hypothetical protein [Asticcacaulis sp.]